MDYEDGKDFSIADNSIGSIARILEFFFLGPRIFTQHELEIFNPLTDEEQVLKDLIHHIISTEEFNLDQYQKFSGKIQSSPLIRMMEILVVSRHRFEEKDLTEAGVELYLKQLEHMLGLSTLGSFLNQLIQVELILNLCGYTPNDQRSKLTFPFNEEMEKRVQEVKANYQDTRFEHFTSVFYVMAARYYFLGGYHEETVDTLGKALEKTDSSFLIFLCNNYIGHMFLFKQDYTTALRYYKRSLAGAESIDPYFDEVREGRYEKIAWIYHHFGICYRHLGEIEQAIYYETKSAELYITINPDRVPMVYNGLIDIFLKIGNLDQCEIYINKYLNFKEEMPGLSENTLETIDWYVERAEIELLQLKGRIRESTELRVQQVNDLLTVLAWNRWDIALYIIDLARTLLIQKDERADYYIEKIEEMSNPNREEMELQLELIAIIRLKNSKRLRDKLEAETKMWDMLEKLHAKHPLRHEIYKLLIELRFYELGGEYDEEIFDELEDLVEKYSGFTRSMHDYLIDHQMQLIRARIELLRVDVGQAESILTQHREHVLDRKLLHLVPEIDEALDQIRDEHRDQSKNPYDDPKMNEYLKFALKMVDE